MFLPEFSDHRLVTSSHDPPAGDRSRLRLVRCQLEHRSGARTRACVQFEGPWFEQPLVFEQEGATCPGGDLRLAARATLDALTHATQGVVRFDLTGVKPTRAFDTNMMLVAVAVHWAGEHRRALGVAVDENNAVLATVRATLHAVNRFVSPMLGPLPLPD